MQLLFNNIEHAVLFEQQRCKKLEMNNLHITFYKFIRLNVISKPYLSP